MDLLKLNLNLLKTLYESLVTFRIQHGSLAGHLGLHGACVYLSHFTISPLKYHAVVPNPIHMFRSPGDYIIVRPRFFSETNSVITLGVQCCSLGGYQEHIQAPVTLDIFENFLCHC